MITKTETYVVGKEQCGSCAAMGSDNSQDNRALYNDGSYHCFACGDNKSNVEANGIMPEAQEEKEPRPMMPMIPGHVQALESRGLTLETCQKFNVRTGSMSGQEVAIFPVYEGAQVVKQKIRGMTDKKLMVQTGDSKNMEMFGKNIFNPSKRIAIVVTEGEYDAMAVFQATGYPAVSGLRGAQGAAKELRANMEWLSEWKHVILCFDDDQPGNDAADKCLKEFEPGTCRVAKLPLKDANEMVLAGRSEEIVKCLWNASVVKPNTLVVASDIREKVLEQPKVGGAWPWDTMTKATYGLRWGETYLLAAATSVGKTEFMREIVSQQLDNGNKVGLFSFEQTPADTIRRFIGARLNKRLHIPGAEGWNPVEIEKAVDELGDSVVLYNSESGMLSLEAVIINIRFANKCHGTKFFVIDNLKSLAANPIIDGKMANEIHFMAHAVAQLSRIARELQVTVFVITHVNTDKISTSYRITDDSANTDLSSGATTRGLRWESGRMPTLENCYGASKITDLVDYIIVLARNRVAEDDEERKITKVKFLKTRLDSAYEGKEFSLNYNYETGRLTEVDPYVPPSNGIIC